MTEDVMKRFEYKIETVTEGMIGTLLLGASSISRGGLEQLLNEHGAEGWELVMQVVERRRMLLFWTREAVILTFKREL
jgi:hypothetical protein